MNYQSHYDRLIARARGRTLDGYRERHHVVPKCMGGGNEPENLVDLTAEEHYVAHQLLVKINPENGLLAFAAIWMTARRKNNKVYGWLRRKQAQAIRNAPYTDERRAKISAALIGRPKSAAHRANQSAAMTGRRLSPESRAKISASLIGNKRSLGTTQSAESNAKRSVAMIGKKNSIGHKRSAESRAKQSATACGKKKPSRSVAHRLALSVAKSGTKHTPEAIQKMVASQRARRDRALQLQARL